MNRHHISTVVLPLALIACTACRLSAAALTRQSNLVERSLRHDALDRTYWLAAPTGYEQASMPLVIMLHGGGGTGRGACLMQGGLLEIARAQGLLLVCPEGIERHWNDGRQIQRWRAHAENVDDVGFLAALVESLAEEYPVDRARVFATGISNGGQMSFRLACERADLVRAIAAVAASMAETLDCAPAVPVSVLILNGTADPLVPYDGGAIGFGRKDTGRMRPTEDVVRFWADLNGCVGPSEDTLLPDLVQDDGTRVRRLAFKDCQDGTRVVLNEIEGGGHTWPQGPQYLPAWIIGRVSQEIEGSQVIWQFFADQPMTK